MLPASLFLPLKVPSVPDTVVPGAFGVVGTPAIECIVIVTYYSSVWIGECIYNSAVSRFVITRNLHEKYIIHAFQFPPLLVASLPVAAVPRAFGVLVKLAVECILVVKL